MIKYLFEDSSRFLLFVILLFGLILSLDSVLSPLTVIDERAETSFETKTNYQLYATYYGYRHVRVSKYNSTVLHIDEYQLLLTEKSQIELVVNLLESGNAQFKVTPLFGQVKSFGDSKNQFITAKNFTYVWGAYLASLAFIIAQILIKLKLKVIEYLVVYPSMFIVVYILFIM